MAALERVAKTDKGDGWGRAWLAALAAIGASFVAFVLIPNWMLTYLSLHVAPHVRDILVTLWWAVGLVVCCWIFVRLQPRRRG